MTCPELAGCRRPLPSELQHCGRAVSLVLNASSATLLRSRDDAAGKELNKLPRAILPSRCVYALEAFICGQIFPGCALGGSLSPCRSTCSRVKQDCNPLILAMMPSDAKQRLECHQYSKGHWPACSQVANANDLPQCLQKLLATPIQDMSGPCKGKALPLVQEPCGSCASDRKGVVKFQSLPVDTCGLCYGDNTSCGGCDGGGGRYDACGICNGESSLCNNLKTEPGLLGHFSLGSCSIAVAILAVALVRCIVIVYSSRWKHVPDSSPKEASAEKGTSFCIASLASLPRFCSRYTGNAFRSFGRLVACYARFVVVAMTLLALMSGTGLLALKVHKDPLSLWVPTDAVSLQNSIRWQQLTSHPRERAVIVLLAARGGDSGAPLREGLLQALAVHESLAKLTIAEGANAANAASSLTLLGRCGTVDPPAGTCHDADRGLLASEFGLVSPLQIWGHNRSTLLEDPQPFATMQQALFADGVPGAFTAELLKGQLNFTFRNNDVSLRALTLTYLLDGSLHRKDAVAAWERAAAGIVNTGKLSNNSGELWPLWQTHMFSEQGLADELSHAIGGDITLVVIGYCLMCSYVSLFIGRHIDCVRSRGLVASAAVLSVALATLTAFGICAALGVVYNETVNIAMFVIMGVGVDDAFLIVKTLEDAEATDAPNTSSALPRLSANDCIAEALSDAGSSIFLSSATNVLAFALGSFTPLPGLSSFCVYASAGMAADFLFQITFFIAVLALDEHRRLAGRCALIPCMTAPQSIASADSGGICAKADQCAFRSCKQTCSKAVLGLTSSPLLQTVALLVYVGTTAASMFAAYKIPVGLRAQDLVPPEASTAAFFKEFTKLLPERQFVEVIVQHQMAVSSDLATSNVASLQDARVHQAVRKLHGSLNATVFVGNDGALGPLWLDTLMETQRMIAVPPERRSQPTPQQLEEFVKSKEGSILEDARSLLIRNGSIVATRLQLLAHEYRAEKMLSLRATIAAAGLQNAAFAQSSADVYHEQDAIMLGYTVRSLSLMTAAVLVMVLLLTANLPMVFIMALCLYSCCTHMFGWMALTGTNLNALSLIPLLLSIGLCMDYCTHIAHAFWSARGSSSERAAAALHTRGMAVANAGISTGLSQLPIAFGRSAVFTTFFSMMCGMVFVGLLHALFVLPVCLSMLPHAADSDDEHEQLGLAPSSPVPADEPPSLMGKPAQDISRHPSV